MYAGIGCTKKSFTTAFHAQTRTSYRHGVNFQSSRSHAMCTGHCLIARVARARLPYAENPVSGAESADPRGSCHQPRRYHVSPATRGSAGLFPQEIRPALQLGPLCFSLLLNLLLISLLYYTHAPQLLHVSPPMRVFSHTQDDPCCTVAGSMAAESVSVTIVSGR